MTDISLRQANIEDVPLIVSLVNSAYRGEISKLGWTTEAHILGGQRTDAEEITRLISTDDSRVLLCDFHNEAVGTAHLKQIEDGVYLGMFTIKPKLQGRGLGKAFLAAVEQHARETWGATKITMSVITLRHELMAYYERRGYRRSGRFCPFPQDPRFGIPRVDDLQLEYMEKCLV